MPRSTHCRSTVLDSCPGGTRTSSCSTSWSTGCRTPLGTPDTPTSCVSNWMAPSELTPRADRYTAVTRSSGTPAPLSWSGLPQRRRSHATSPTCQRPVTGGGWAIGAAMFWVVGDIDCGGARRDGQVAVACWSRRSGSAVGDSGGARGDWKRPKGPPLASWIGSPWTYRSSKIGLQRARQDPPSAVSHLDHRPGGSVHSGASSRRFACSLVGSGHRDRFDPSRRLDGRFGGQQTPSQLINAELRYSFGQ